MASAVDPSTFFHLVPQNEKSRELLHLSENENFLSRACTGVIGIEIGSHVSRVPGRVLARLGRGRTADLFLPGENIASIHAAFELHPETKVVLLSVRAKNTASVTVQTCSVRHGESAGQDAEQVTGEVVEGDCVLVHGQEYIVKIFAYEFKIVWSYKPNWQGFVEDEFEKISRCGKLVRPRDRPTVDSSTCYTWHNTRIHTISRVLFREAPGTQRTRLGAGGFGSVYQAVDFESGEPFAIKVITITKPAQGNVDAYARYDYERSLVHKEIKMLAKLKHRNIIKLLGYDKMDTLEPEIFMPIRPGSVYDLKEADKSVNGSGHQICGGEFCDLLLEQMLSALDYLASMNVSHRDIKPANILYYKAGDRVRDYVFELADFGLSKNQTSILNWAGTPVYMAPETWQSVASAPSPKMDVWSLFATIIDVRPEFEEFPPKCPDFLPQVQYTEAVAAIQRAAARIESLAPMARMDPNERASAAQLLLHLFDGRGLTTPRNKIPPLATHFTPSVPPNVPGPVPVMPSSNLSSFAYSGTSRVLAATLRLERSRPLLQYLRPRQGRSGAGADGISARGGISKPVAYAGLTRGAKRVPVKPQAVPKVSPQEGNTTE